MRKFFFQPMMVPIILIAAGVFFVYARVGLISTLTGLVLAHIMLALPYVIIALLAGLLPLMEYLGHLLRTPAVMLVLAVIGVLLVVWSFHIDPAAIRKRGGDPEASARRWTHRARQAAGRPLLLIGLALLAGVIEAASMIPYLAAMGIIADMGVGLGTGALILVGYCALMIAPAAILAGVRAALGGRADRLMDRLHSWAVKNASSAFSWAIGIIGVIILINTAAPALDALGAG